MAKKLPKKAIRDKVNVNLHLSPVEARIHSLLTTQDGKSPDEDNPYVVLKYFREQFECFSDWEKDELKQFSTFLDQLRKRTWRQVMETSGKSNKHGLAYTPYDIAKVGDSIREQFKEVRKQIAEDINFFELRVDQNKLRVHGFRSKAGFFLVLLDREHRVWPQG